MTKIVLTKAYGNRVYIDKERILEVHEVSKSGGVNSMVVFKGGKEPEYYEVRETFDEVRAIMEFEPEVADIVIKGKELS